MNTSTLEKMSRMKLYGMHFALHALINNKTAKQLDTS
jgi:hypothetical protein